MGAVEMAAEAAPIALAEAKAYLRIEQDDEDALIAGLIRAATGLCERFVGQALIAREAEEIVPASGAWRRLSLTPVIAIEGIEAIGEDGEADPLPVEGYAIDIDGNGDGWVRLTAPAPMLDSGAPARVRVTYVAGMGSDWNATPEALRQGIVRLVAHLYANREDAGAMAPPACVAALWRPWRRMRLS